MNKFFKEHKQTIEDNEFSAKLFSRLDYIPASESSARRSKKIIFIFATIGIVLFILMGGYSSLIDGLSSMSTLFENFKSIRAEVVVSVVFMICSIVALGRFAFEEE